LKNGIERMLMHYVPEVKGVEQVSPTFWVCVDAWKRLTYRYLMKRRRLRWTNLQS
jgi:hypothetical protein